MGTSSHRPLFSFAGRHDPVPLVFAWPANCEAVVDEREDHNDRGHSTRFRLRFVEDGALRRLILDAFELRTDDGGPCDRDLEVSRYEARLGLVCELRIDAGGVARTSRPLEPHQIAAVLALAAPDELVALEDELRAPGVAEAARDRPLQLWRSWVESWLDLRLVPGVKQDLDMPPSVLRHVTLHLREDERGPLVVLDEGYSERHPITAAEAAERRSIDGWSVDVGEVLETTMIATLELELHTLRPLTSMRAQQLDMRRDGDALRSVLIRQHTFHWSDRE